MAEEGGYGYLLSSTTKYISLYIPTLYTGLFLFGLAEGYTIKRCRY